MSTICAISTPQGIGGIAVIRISGSESVSIADNLFEGKRSLTDARGYSVHYGTFAGLDDVILTVFRAPHSFTGEDVVEIACHGSLYIQQELLRVLIEAGCRMAEAGEFTKRAFLNGKMDLTEAEAVADLIAAESRSAHQIALNHLRGGISSELGQLRDRLLHFTSLIELELDFADHEELEFADRSELNNLAQEISKHLDKLIASFSLGNALKNGIPVAIIGPTNAGKSTLLNALAGEDRAIVSDIHGTTRDTIEDVINIEGVRFRFIDTAGLRNTDNEIESMGIQRSIEAARKADIILFVKDITQEENTDLLEGIDTSKKTVITILNKADLLQKPQAITDENTITLSAKSGEIDCLKQALIKSVPKQQNSGVIVSNARHYEALLNASKAIKRVEKGLQEGISGEFLSMDLQDCLNALGEITGQVTSQEVLNNIFSHFCIGK